MTTPHGPGTDEPENRWTSRPALAAVLRTAVLAAPPVSALLVALLVMSQVSSSAPLAVRVLLVAGVAVVTALLLERLLRRLLPVESLLRMTMLFPGRAPSRLTVARLGRSRAEIERRLLDPDGAGDVAAAMLALITALGRHDKRTRGHSERVRMITELLADELQLPRGDRDRLRWAALLHDIGKLDVAASILSKPGPLDDVEWSKMRQHPAHGARLAGPFLEWLGEWAGGIAHHHERFDGGGYPYGLAGEDISRAGRIVCVVDAFETMTAARAYKRASGTQHGLAELARCAGTQFDPVVVRSFLQISLPKLWWATGPLGLLVQVPVIGAAQNSAAQATSGLTAAATTSVTVAGTAAVIGVGSTFVVSPAVATPGPAVTAAAAEHRETGSSTSTAAATATPAATVQAGPSAAPPTAEPSSGVTSASADGAGGEKVVLAPARRSGGVVQALAQSATATTAPASGTTPGVAAPSDAAPTSAPVVVAPTGPDPTAPTPTPTPQPDDHPGGEPVAGPVVAVPDVVVPPEPEVTPDPEVTPQPEVTPEPVVAPVEDGEGGEGGEDGEND